MSNRSGLMSITTDIFAAPDTAFGNLKEKGRAWFPLIILLFVVALSQIIYFQGLNFDWFIEYSVASQGTDISPAEKEQIASMMAGTSKGLYLGISLAGIVIATPIVFAIFSVFYLIVSSIRNDNLTFGQCFTLVSWSSLVTIISYFVGMAIVATGDGQIPPEAIQGLTLNSLIFHTEVGDAWYNWLSRVDITSLWSAAIIGIGYRKWTNASLGAAMFIGFLPTILIFGIWAALI